MAQRDLLNAMEIGAARGNGEQPPTTARDQIQDRYLPTALVTAGYRAFGRDLNALSVAGPALPEIRSRVAWKATSEPYKFVPSGARPPVEPDRQSVAELGQELPGRPDQDSGKAKTSVQGRSRLLGSMGDGHLDYEHRLA